MHPLDWPIARTPRQPTVTEAQGLQLRRPSGSRHHRRSRSSAVLGAQRRHGSDTSAMEVLWKCHGSAMEMTYVVTYVVAYVVTYCDGYGW